MDRKYLMVMLTLKRIDGIDKDTILGNGYGWIGTSIKYSHARHRIYNKHEGCWAIIKILFNVFQISCLCVESLECFLCKTAVESFTKAIQICGAPKDCQYRYRHHLIRLSFRTHRGTILSSPARWRSLWAWRSLRGHRTLSQRHHQKTRRTLPQLLWAT